MENEIDIFTQIQTFLDNVKALHEKEINWYDEEFKYLQNVCNEQTMELQRLNGLLDERNEEIKRLRGDQSLFQEV